MKSPFRVVVLAFAVLATLTCNFVVDVRHDAGVFCSTHPNQSRCQADVSAVLGSCLWSTQAKSCFSANAGCPNYPVQDVCEKARCNWQDGKCTANSILTACTSLLNEAACLNASLTGCDWPSDEIGCVTPNSCASKVGEANCDGFTCTWDSVTSQCTSTLYPCGTYTADKCPEVQGCVTTLDNKCAGACILNYTRYQCANQPGCEWTGFLDVIGGGYCNFIPKPTGNI